MKLACAYVSYETCWWQEPLLAARKEMALEAGIVTSGRTGTGLPGADTLLWESLLAIQRQAHVRCAARCQWLERKGAYTAPRN